jgi:zinc protease
MSVDLPVLDEKAGARIREHTLSNGLRVLFVERHLDPVVAVMLWYRVGSRDEDEKTAGVSHFLEHMMFKGSAGFGKGEVDRVTTLLGGSNNAFTTNDHTAYWFELASDRFEAALAIEADRMRALLLDPAEFAAEKDVVLEELAMGQDDPWRRLSELVQESVFGRHPYRRPIIGHADALKRLTVEEMRAHHARYYRPSNAILVVCGDFDPARTLELVERHLGSYTPSPESAEQPFRPAIAEPVGEKRLAMTWDDEGRRLCMAWPSGAVGTREDWTLDVVSTLLTGGRLSRLHRRLVLERGLATTVSTQNDARVDGGAFWLLAECAQGASPATLEAAIDAELARLRDEAVPAKELERAKRILIAGEAYDSETVSDLAEELGEFAIDADWRLSLQTVERIRGVTGADVRAVARRLLVDARRTLAWSLPRQASKSSSKPAAAAPAGAKSRARSASTTRKTPVARKPGRKPDAKKGARR